MIKFKIISFDEQQHSALVNYYADFYPEGVTYNLEIRPDEDGNYPSQENFLAFVHMNTPVHLFQKIQAQQKNNITHLLDFANTEHEYDPTKKMNSSEKIDEELNKLIQMMVNETKI